MTVLELNVPDNMIIKLDFVTMQQFSLKQNNVFFVFFSSNILTPRPKKRKNPSIFSRLSKALTNLLDRLIKAPTVPPTGGIYIFQTREREGMFTNDE